MNKIILGLIGSIIIAECYRRYTSKNGKKDWEDFVKMHHGEFGVILAALGAATKSPSAIGAGLGLIFHDKDDHKKWFKRKTR